MQHVQFYFTSLSITDLIKQITPVFPEYSRICEVFYPRLKNLLTRTEKKCKGNDENSFDPWREERHFVKTVNETCRMLYNPQTETNPDFSMNNK